MCDKRTNLIEKEGFTFRFNPDACTACQGKCCNGESGNVFVNGKEIEAISDFLGIETSTFIDKYLVKVSYRFSIREITTDGNYACIFFDNKKKRCSIYPARPNQCRSFPFWSYFKDRPEEAARECPGVSLCEKRHKTNACTGSGATIIREQGTSTLSQRS